MIVEILFYRECENQKFGEDTSSDEDDDDDDSDLEEDDSDLEEEEDNNEEELEDEKIYKEFSMSMREEVNLSDSYRLILALRRHKD